MAIGSVLELVDYKKETIKIAKQHGGTKIDLDAIADEYDPERTTPYPVGDLVIYNGDLYKASAQVPTRAGAFKPEMWDEVGVYDETVAYSYGQYVVYDGVLYRNTFLAPQTPESWNPEHWQAASVNSYDTTATNYQRFTTIEYDTKYYTANSNYANDPVGEFNLLYWTPTSIEQLIGNVIDRVSVNLYGITTDENGLIDMSSIVASNTRLTGKVIISIIPNPFGGMAPAGKTGYFLTRINQNYFLLEKLVEGVRSPVASTELDSEYMFNFYCI